MPDVIHCTTCTAATSTCGRCRSWRVRRHGATLHDAWLFTGHCAYPLDSDGWLRGCGGCPHLDVYPALHRDGTALNLAPQAVDLRRARTDVVTPSSWLMEMGLERRCWGRPPCGAGDPERRRPRVFAPGPHEARSGDAMRRCSSSPRRAAARTSSRTSRPLEATALDRLDRPVELVVARRSARHASRRCVRRALRDADLYVHATRADNLPQRRPRGARIGHAGRGQPRRRHPGAGHRGDRRPRRARRPERARGWDRAAPRRSGVARGWASAAVRRTRAISAGATAGVVSRLYSELG